MTARCCSLHKKLKTGTGSNTRENRKPRKRFLFQSNRQCLNLRITQIKIKTKRWKVDQLLSGSNLTPRQEICKQTAEILEGRGLR